MEGESLFIRSFCIDAVFVWNWQRTNMHGVVEPCSSGANTKCLRILNRPAFVFFWNRSLVVPILVWRTFHLVLFQLPRGLDHTSHLRNSLGVWKMPNFDIHTNWYLLILTLAQFDDFDTCSFWFWYRPLLITDFETCSFKVFVVSFTDFCTGPLAAFAGLELEEAFYGMTIEQVTSDSCCRWRSF